MFIASFIIYNLCVYYEFKILPILSNIYNCITKWANRQVSSWAFAIRSPGIFIWILFVTHLLFTICVQMDSYVQLMCYTSLPYLWPSIIYSFLEKRALLFYSWDRITYWHFLCSNTYLPYEGPVKYLQSLCCPCSMWNLIIIYISCTLTHKFSGSDHNLFRYFLLCLISLLTLSAKPYE